MAVQSIWPFFTLSDSTMGFSDYRRKHGLSRRGFLAGVGAGLAAGVPLGWLALRELEKFGHDNDFRSFTGVSKESSHSEFAMPGPFPGRVIEVNHPGSVSVNETI